MTVTASQIQIAKMNGLQNIDAAARVANETGIKFNHLCALLEHESGGKNVYGHDAGGALSGFPYQVDASNYAVFRWLVFTKGQTSNGVGPMQLTSKGFFTDMEKQQLKPYDVHDNMAYGAKLWVKYYKAARTDGKTPNEAVKVAATRYNGASAYGTRHLEIVKKWRTLVGDADYA